MIHALALVAVLAAPQWVRDLNQPVTGTTKGVVLLDEWNVTVLENGDIREVHRVAYRVLTPEGRDLGRAYAYFGGNRKLNAMRGWSLSPGGEKEVGNKDAIESAAFSGELYADQRLRVLSVPADAGSVVAFETDVTITPYALQDVWQFQRALPVKVARYALTLPPQWKADARWLRATPVEPKSGVYEIRDVPALDDEPRMPSAGVAPALALTFVPPGDALRGRVQRTWNDVGLWYAALVADRQMLTPAMQSRARELTANVANPIDRIRALASFAQRDIRYVAIEIGIGGFRPHAASDVFAMRYGDCKDKVTILGALLREIGIESYYVLASTERGAVEPDFASLHSFNHAIIAIPVSKDAVAMPAVVQHSKLGALLLFDPTAETTPFGQLPPYLQENRVLVVSKSGGELLNVTPHAPQTSRLERRAKLTLDPAGKLTGTVQETRTGAIAANYRAALQSMNDAERKQWIERGVGSHVSQFSVRDLTVENLADLNADLVVKYTLEVPGYARKAGSMLLVRPRVLGRKADALLEAKERKHPYETSGTSLETDEVEIAVTSTRAEELPAKIDLETPAAKYKSETTFAAGVLRYKRSYELRQAVVPAAGIAELNKVFAQILADERATALLK